MNFVTTNFRGQRVVLYSWLVREAAVGGWVKGCTRSRVADRGCRWFVSEDEINSAVGFIAVRRKRPVEKGQM